MRNPRIKPYYRLYRRKTRQLQEKLSALGIQDYTITIVFSVLIGIAAGLAAVLFHDTVELFHHLLFDIGAGVMGGSLAVGVIFFPAIGMFLQSLMIRFSPKIAAQRGVLEVIKAVAVRGGQIPMRSTAFHFLAPAICIGTGGTVGPEGPIAQLGGGVASNIGSVLGLSDSRRRMFTAAGSGAAIAAVFNTPLGGVFFALEVILLNDFRTPTFSALILASVAASAVSHIFLGNNPTFVFHEISIGSYRDFYLFAILGIFAGLISLLYLRYSERLHSFFHLPLIVKIPKMILMPLVGLIVGGCGYFYPQIFGVGYKAINEMLAGAHIWQTVLVLLVMKFILVPLILSAGGFGGIFAPSLFIGACLGYLFATALNVLEFATVDVSAYVLVGMGAVLGGINSIPISAIMIIFEMTREYSFMLPLMLSVVISTTIVRLAIRDSIYNRRLQQQGWQLTGGREANILRALFVRDTMRRDVMLIREDTGLPKLIDKMLANPHKTFYTVNSDGKLTGMIAESELRQLITEYQNLREIIVAQDVACPGVLFVSEDDNLQKVMQLFAQNNVEEFPVVSAKNRDHVIGAIHRQDVLTAYNRESLKFNLADGFANELQLLEKNAAVQVAGDYSLAERRVPQMFVGKTLAELRLRNEYDLEVLMIRQARPFSHEEESFKLLMAVPDYRLQEGDTLVLFGKNRAIRKTETWK